MKQFQREQNSEAGQATIIVVIALGTFLLGSMGFATDFANIWFHREKAQSAADAACQAGAMDMLGIAEGTNTITSAGFTPGTAFDCASASSASPCKYAALNSYSGVGLTAGTESNDVSVTFPSAVTGVTAPPTSLAGSYPFMRVAVTDRIRVYFSALLTARKTQDVVVQAKCGLVLEQSPIPIIVLDPKSSGSFAINGTPSVIITGGPTKSIQVNSTSTTAYVVKGGGSGSIDLSKGGPTYSGSSMGLVGGPYAVPSNFTSATPYSAYWDPASAPIGDPFAQLPSPAKGITQSGSTAAAYNVHGCPDHAGCDEYAPGYYPNGIQAKGGTSIFDPGVYYVDSGSIAPGLALASNSIVRPADPSGTYDGTMFYFVNGGSVSVAANSGVPKTGSTVDSFLTSNVRCPAAGSAPVTIKNSSGAVVTSLDGNIMMGVCAGTYGDPLGLNRGMLFFEDRSSDLTAKKAQQPSWGGGGQFLLAGNMYFHNSSNFGDSFTLSGNSGSGTYVLGDIVADQLTLGGTSTIMMQLNPTSAYNVLKVELLQ